MGVLVAGVSLREMSGETAQAAQLGILGTGVYQVHGQWGPNVPAVRPPLGAALLVSRQPRDRMGFGRPARKHARHQLEWHVHRIDRSVVDWGGIYRAFGIGQARESRLFGEAHRARTRHGRVRDACRWTARTAVPGSPVFSLQHRFVSSSYTMLAATRRGSRGLCCAKLSTPPSFETAFEVA
jgi:hypothetical protein